MPNVFQRLISPRFPAAAVCLEGDFASVAALDRRRGSLVLQAAAQIPLPADLVTPAFDQPNIKNPVELTDLLAGLILNAGLARRERWSAALPELAARTTLLVLETDPASNVEKEEMLGWKTERSFGVPVGELRITREQLRPDERGRPRYLVSAVRIDVLAEYEAIFNSLNWQAGLILPRHLCEAQWLQNGGGDGRAAGDALLISSHREGFTALVLRRGEPMIVRHVHCDAEDCTDELYRLLLFYKDRAGGQEEGETASAEQKIERILVVGDALPDREVSDCVQETLAVRPRVLDAEAIGLVLPASDLSFETLAAPAGLAAMKWA